MRAGLVPALVGVLLLGYPKTLGAQPIPCPGKDSEDACAKCCKNFGSGKQGSDCMFYCQAGAIVDVGESKAMGGECYICKAPVCPGGDGGDGGKCDPKETCYNELKGAGYLESEGLLMINQCVSIVHECKGSTE